MVILVGMSSMKWDESESIVDNINILLDKDSDKAYTIKLNQDMKSLIPIKLNYPPTPYHSTFFHNIHQQKKIYGNQ